MQSFRQLLRRNAGTVSPHWLVAARLIMQGLYEHLNVELFLTWTKNNKPLMKQQNANGEPPLNASLSSGHHRRWDQREPTGDPNPRPADPNVHRGFRAAGYFSPSLHHCMSLELPSSFQPAYAHIYILSEEL